MLVVAMPSSQDKIVKKANDGSPEAWRPKMDAATPVDHSKLRGWEETMQTAHVPDFLAAYGDRLKYGGLY